MLKYFDKDAIFYILVPVFDWLLLSTFYYSFKKIVISASVEYNFNVPFKFYLKQIGSIMIIYWLVWFITQNINAPHKQVSQIYKLAFMVVLPSFVGLFSGITSVLKLTDQEKEVLIKKKKNSEKWNQNLY